MFVDEVRMGFHADSAMAPEPDHQKAFCFLRKTAIDQHINTRNRWDDHPAGASGEKSGDGGP